jgi:acetyl esterase/lipase
MVYLSLHRILLGRSTGIHPDVSLEYHALTSICWWTRLFPVTIERMRFALNQLQVYHPPSPNIKTRTITITANSGAVTATTAGSISRSSATDTNGTNNSGTARNQDTHGVFISLRSASKEDDNPHASIKKVVFWIFGGGFLAGDVEGNVGCAEKIATQCDADAVFVANYRLAPEYDFQDISDDVYDAYNKLLSSYNVSPKNIIVYGISSGKHVCLALEAILCCCFFL